MRPTGAIQPLPGFLVCIGGAAEAVPAEVVRMGLRTPRRETPLIATGREQWQSKGMMTYAMSSSCRRWGAATAGSACVRSSACVATRGSCAARVREARRPPLSASLRASHVPVGVVFLLADFPTRRQLRSMRHRARRGGRLCKLVHLARYPPAPSLRDPGLANPNRGDPRGSPTE